MAAYPGIYVNDATNSFTRVKKIFVNDSGTFRRIVRIFAHDGLLRQVWGAVHDFSVVQALNVNGGTTQDGFGVAPYFVVFGSCSGATLPDGRTIVGAWTQAGTLAGGHLYITGFGGVNPGQNYFNSFINNTFTTTKDAPSATYSWDGTLAHWYWPAGGIIGGGINGCNLVY